MAHAIPEQNMVRVVEEQSEDIVPVMNEFMSQFNNQFKRGSKLGNGSFGEVWKIINDGSKFALKVVPINKNKKNRFRQLEREIDIMKLYKNQNSRHPGLRHLVQIDLAWSVTVLNNPNGLDECRKWLNRYDDRDDFSEEDWLELERVIFIKMEFCGEGTLGGWLKNVGKSNYLEQGKRFFYQIVSGLACLQESQLSVIHRDLKPENIMLTKDPKNRNEVIVKIGDFGLSRQKMQDSESLMSSSVGTNMFRAPELKKNEKDYTAKVDIFSLGIILFFILEPPLYSQGYNDLMKIVDKFDRENPTIPQSFEEDFPDEVKILKWLLKNDPVERPSATKLQNQISTWQSSSSDSPFTQIRPVESELSAEASRNETWSSAKSVFLKNWESVGLENLLRPHLVYLCGNSTSIFTMKLVAYSANVISRDEFENNRRTRFEECADFYSIFMKKNAGEELLKAWEQSLNSHLVLELNKKSNPT